MLTANVPQRTTALQRIYVVNPLSMAAQQLTALSGTAVKSLWLPCVLPSDLCT